MTLFSGIQSSSLAKASEDSIKIKDARYLALLLENNHKSDSLRDKSDSLRDKIDSSKDIIIKLQKQSKQEGNMIRDSLNMAKSQIIKIQKNNYSDLFNLTTGGNNYPEIEPGIHVNERRISFEVKNISEFPIYDLIISYSDPIKAAELYSRKKPEYYTDEDIAYYQIKKNLGNLSPKDYKMLFNYTMPDNVEKQRFIFQMSTRTGQYEQLFDITKDINSIYIIHGYLRKHNSEVLIQSKNIREY